MTASDGREPKSQLIRTDASRSTGPSDLSMSRTIIEAPALNRPLVLAKFIFSTWRVPRMAKPLRSYERGGDL
jgi:hypothetical protein